MCFSYSKRLCSLTIDDTENHSAMNIYSRILCIIQCTHFTLASYGAKDHNKHTEWIDKVRKKRGFRLHPLLLQLCFFHSGTLISNQKGITFNKFVKSSAANAVDSKLLFFGLCVYFGYEDWIWIHNTWIYVQWKCIECMICQILRCISLRIAWKNDSIWIEKKK